MTTQDYLTLLEHLTGTPKKTSPSDEEFLTEVLADDEKIIDLSQFNELLLIANKDRVEAPFFSLFFSGGCEEDPTCRIKDLASGVEHFQKAAMFSFGNFIYAYRRLSKITNRKQLCEELCGWFSDSNELLKSYQIRAAKMLEIESIAKEDTYLIGYISPAEIIAEHSRAVRLEELIVSLEKDKRNWNQLTQAIDKGVNAESQVAELTNLVEKFQQITSETTTVDDLAQVLKKDIEDLKYLKEQKLVEARRKGIRNTNVYLSWDHMDIYFATSMRKRWEFESLYAFVNELMNSEKLTELNLRYFDPTQSFEDNRIDKGIIESLMLKRASCTVYSVQDTDTLGKDSELAATLAQGKPVITYAPTIQIDDRCSKLALERPRAIKDRLHFVFYSDDSFSMRPDAELKYIQECVQIIDEFEGKMLWRSLSDKDAIERFQSDNAGKLTRFYRMIAEAEKKIYDKRAQTLQNSHPLGIQVNLESGVANGVLVVRDIPTCAELIRRILLNEMEFDVVDDSQTDCWLLKEKLTNCIFRVVTKKQKLTNSFWNFYRSEGDSRYGKEVSH